MYDYLPLLCLDKLLTEVEHPANASRSTSTLTSTLSHIPCVTSKDHHSKMMRVTKYAAHTQTHMSTCNTQQLKHLPINKTTCWQLCHHIICALKSGIYLLVYTRCLGNTYYNRLVSPFGNAISVNPTL